MNLQKIYKEVLKRLEEIHFDDIYPGFSLYPFAVYDEHHVCLNGKMIEKTEQFMANTAIEYKGDFIAIWNLAEEMDFDVLASKLAHEMFHAHQMKHGDQRFPNEMDALYNYRFSVENLSLKYQENQLIIELIDQFHDSSFKRLLALRKRRSIDFPFELQYETMIEEIEGSANYIELEVLKLLSEDLYKMKLSMMKKQITTVDMMFPIRIISYDIGALLLKIVMEHLPMVHLEFDDVPFPVKLMKDATSYDGDISKVKEIENAIDRYHEKTDALVKNALDIENVVAEGEFDLLGVNIYNARYKKPYMVSTYFVMYLNQGEKTVKQGNFVIELTSSHKVKRILKY